MVRPVPARLLSLLVLLFAALHTWAQAPLVLTPDTQRADLASHMSLLRDASGTMGIEDVANSSAWKNLPGAFNVGFTDDALWLRIEVERSAASPREWVLEINNAVLDDLRLYRRTANGGWEMHVAGEDFPRADWDMPYRSPIFRPDFAEPGRHTLWLRVTARNSISAQMTFWRPPSFGEASRAESLAYGLLFGSYIIFIVLHAFFWRWTRDALSGWYALYVFDSLGQMAISFGYLQQYTGMPGRISDVVLSLMLCASPWVAARLFIGMLELDRVMPRTARWFGHATSALSAVTLVLATTVSYAAGVAPTQLAVLVEIVVLVGLALHLWRQGHRPALLFLAAFGPFIAGIVVRVMRNFTLLPPNFVTDNGYQIGAIAHMIAMSLVLMNRYNAMKAAMAEAHAEALRLKTEHAETLEAEVLARTASLTEEIARREVLEAELRAALDVEKHARQEQRDFVAMVSHEFRTPLAIIDTSAQRIAGTSPLGATRERCGNIREATRRMTRLMDEFLSLDRMEGDLRTFAAREEDATAVVQRAAAEWDRGSVEVSCANLPSRLSCDAGLLHVALRNLLANAMRHSPEGVPVRLVARGCGDGGVEFEIVDAGHGIPADEIPKLFQKYFRGRGSQDKPGAGLGLYLVERIAKLHGGSVSVTSDATGSRFVLGVPGLHTPVAAASMAD